MANDATTDRVLLFGVNGQLGHELQRTLRPLGELFALQRSDADFGRPDNLPDIVRQIRPTVLVNAAAYTTVDKAESESELAMTVNSTAPAVLARAAEETGACFVHYSTDYVFDGRRGRPYREDMHTNPLSAYGRSKLAGEREVSDVCRRHLIIRSSWVFGSHGKNFPKTMLRLAAEKKSLRVVNDQKGSPTSAELIAISTASMLKQLVTAAPDDRRWGTYHVTADGETTWFGFAKYVIERARTMGLKLGVTAQDIVPISTAEYPLPAVRPAYSVLDTSKVRQAFGLVLPNWEEGVNRVVDDIARNQQ